MSKDRLKFKLKNYYVFNNIEIPYDPSLTKDFAPLIYEPNFSSKSLKLLFHRFEPLIHQLIDLRNFLLVDGFIESTLSSLMKKYLLSDNIFLEIGCGDMNIRHFLPLTTYNAFDVRLSKYNLLRAIKDSRSNIAIASILHIPLPDNSVDFVLLSEVLYEVADINQAIDEIYRVLKKNGKVCLSISNSYCYKYQKKGPHPKAKNFWSYSSFIDFMIKNKFILLESLMKGYWIPIPKFITKISFQLPFSHHQELYNTNFFYVFQK